MTDGASHVTVEGYRHCHHCERNANGDLECDPAGPVVAGVRLHSVACEPCIGEGAEPMLIVVTKRTGA